ncbi:MAG: RDD family protein [Bacteroidales bacterium]
MPSTDITTAQKITITYELASFGERFLAFLIDLIIIGVFSFVMMFLGTIVFLDRVDYFAYIVVLPVATLYTLGFEIFNRGQTPGKMIMGIKVMKLEGDRPIPGDYLMRWIFRAVDIWSSLGTLALILISSSDKNQRLGDLLANTIVVRIRSSEEVPLARLLQMRTREAYEPTYPSVVQMSEPEMIRVKELLERLKRNPGEGPLKALDIASQNIADKLMIPLEPYHPYFETNPFIRTSEREKRIAFLNTLLKDYIILTR